MLPTGLVRMGTPPRRATWAPAVNARTISRASRNARRRTMAGSGPVHAAGSGVPRHAPNSLWSSARLMAPIPIALSNSPAVVSSFGATGRASVGHEAPRFVELDGGQMGTGHWLVPGRNVGPNCVSSYGKTPLDRVVKIRRRRAPSGMNRGKTGSLPRNWVKVLVRPTAWHAVIWAAVGP